MGWSEGPDTSAQVHRSQNTDLGKGVLTPPVEGDCACNLEGHIGAAVGMDTLRNTQ